MKKVSIFIFFLLICLSQIYSQTNRKVRIIGNMPNVKSNKSYILYIGAYETNNHWANYWFRKLERNNLNPTRVRQKNLTFLMIRSVKAKDVPFYLEKLKKVGILSVQIVEEISKNKNFISAKWEIISPNSNYSSFEFNDDGNYVVVEIPKDNSDKAVHFGNYKIREKDIYELIDLGVLKVKKHDDKNIDFSFSHVDEPEKETNLKAKKSKTMPKSQKTDLFSRSWRLVESNYPSCEPGEIWFFSEAGTYLIVNNSGETILLSQWRWYDEKNNLWEYSHDNGITWDRLKETTITKNLYTFTDAVDYFYKFVPADIYDKK